MSVGSMNKTLYAVFVLFMAPTRRISCRGLHGAHGLHYRLWIGNSEAAHPMFCFMWVNTRPDNIIELFPFVGNKHAL